MMKCTVTSYEMTLIIPIYLDKNKCSQILYNTSRLVLKNITRIKSNQTNICDLNLIIRHIYNTSNKISLLNMLLLSKLSHKCVL